MQSVKCKMYTHFFTISNKHFTLGYTQSLQLNLIQLYHPHPYFPSSLPTDKDTHSPNLARLYITQFMLYTVERTITMHKS